MQPGCQYALMTEPSGNACAMDVLLGHRRRILRPAGRRQDVTAKRREPQRPTANLSDCIWPMVASPSRVPFILNYPLNETYAERAARGGLRNFHIFDIAINGVAT